VIASRRAAVVFALAAALQSCGIYYAEEEPGTGDLPGEEGAAGPRFRAVADAVAAWWLAVHPVQASALGFREYDSRLDSLSAADLAARTDALRRHLGRLQTVDTSRLGPSDREDLGLLRRSLEAALAAEGAEFRDPAFYLRLLSEGLRQCADPFATAARLGAVREILAQARLNVKESPKLLVEAAQAEHADLKDYVEKELRAEKASSSLKSDLEEARKGALVALEEFGVHLSKTLLPAAAGDARLGVEHFRRLTGVRDVNADAAGAAVPEAPTTLVRRVFEDRGLVQARRLGLEGAAARWRAAVAFHVEGADLDAVAAELRSKFKLEAAAAARLARAAAADPAGDLRWPALAAARAR
jgi:hypothetical protein